MCELDPIGIYDGYAVPEDAWQPKYKGKKCERYKTKKATL